MSETKGQKLVRRLKSYVESLEDGNPAVLREPANSLTERQFIDTLCHLLGINTGIGYDGINDDSDVVIYQQVILDEIPKALAGMPSIYRLHRAAETEAIEIARDCQRGLQRCHECPDTECCDNTRPKTAIQS